MASIDERIFDALATRVLSLPFSPGMPFAWPNKAFVPTDQFIRVTVVPNTNERLYISGIRTVTRRLGILQLSVFTKLNDGVEDGLSLVTVIKDHFPCDLILRSALPVDSGEPDVRVQITNLPSDAQGMRDESNWHIPVSIPYEVLV